MRVALLAMPWRNLLTPSHQLALLEPLVRQAGGHATSLHLYLDVAAAWGSERYQRWHQRLRHLPLAQEALYAGLLFPERRHLIDKALTAYGLPPDDPAFWGEWQAAHDQAFAAIDWTTYDWVIVWSHGVVSAPTTQYLAGIEAARRIRNTVPDVPILLAGPAYTGEIGHSLLNVVPWVDGVIDGEPESAVQVLVESRATAPQALPGLRWRPETGLSFQPGRAADLADLPVPDYHSFFAHPLAQTLSQPLLRTEAARGCWWDRSDRDPRLSCQFCNINVATPGYRRKPLEQVAYEVQALATTYPTQRLGFGDTITWPQEATDLFAAIADQDLNVAFHGLEAHVTLDRQALWQMRRAGVRTVQFGVEALSPSLLQRMGKGIRYESIVEALRACAELGIGVKANLILDYPGATAEDVDLTLTRLQELSWLPPLELSVATIGYGSPLHRLWADRGIARLAPAPVYQDLLPPEWASNLTLMHYSYEPADPMPDWDPVRRFVEHWQNRWQSSPVALRRIYVDRPEERSDALALLAFDAQERASITWLNGAERRLFLYCLEARRLASITDVFGSDSWIEAALDDWYATGHISRIGDKVLSLGTAADETGRRWLSQLMSDPVPAPPTAQAPVRLRLRPNPGRR